MVAVGSIPMAIAGLIASLLSVVMTNVGLSVNSQQATECGGKGASMNAMQKLLFSILTFGGALGASVAAGALST